MRIMVWEPVRDHVAAGWTATLKSVRLRPWFHWAKQGVAERYLLGSQRDLGMASRPHRPGSIPANALADTSRMGFRTRPRPPGDKERSGELCHRSRCASRSWADHSPAPTGEPSPIRAQDTEKVATGPCTATF